MKAFLAHRRLGIIMNICAKGSIVLLEKSAYSAVESSAFDRLVIFHLDQFVSTNDQRSVQ